MRGRSGASSALVAVCSLSIAAGACASLGGILPGSDGQVVGEVRYVDERYREIEVRTERGEIERVEYDDRTTVYYRDEQYRVSALERGDLVAMDVREGGNGRLYTQRIDVRETAQDRGYGGIGLGQARDARDVAGRSPSVLGEGGGVQKLTGYVARIDASGGAFELRLADRSSVLIRLPDRPPDAVAETFGRLREGSHVRMRVEWIGDAVARLLEFV